MSSLPRISVILSTYQRPEHLRRSLRSLAGQRGVDGQFEVVVTDDGSTDHTADVVRRMAGAVPFPLTFVTHEHRGFRLALCRNEGVRASSGTYLLFSDGDCLFPPDHLLQHLRMRRQGVARSGDCIRLDKGSTRRVDDDAIASAAYVAWATRTERWRIRRRWIKDRLYRAIRHPSKPTMTGCNIGVSRDDFEQVNGFDERFVGWGCEDNDLAVRLRRSGVLTASILGHTRVYHMWHPYDPTQPATWRGGANVNYFLRRDRPTYCYLGLTSHEPRQSAGTVGPAAREEAPAPARRSAA